MAGEKVPHGMAKVVRQELGEEVHRGKSTRWSPTDKELREAIEDWKVAGDDTAVMNGERLLEKRKQQ